MAAPYISVIIPAYNARGSVERSVRSALHQEDADVEVVVVDDGSTDGTGELIGDVFGSDRRVRIETLAKPSGTPGPPRNIGAVLATGARLIFLDADDQLLPNAVKAQRTADAEVVSFGEIIVRFSEGDRLASDLWVLPRAPLDSLQVNFFPIHAASIDRRLFHRLGGFSQRPPVFEDWQFWIKAALAGVEFQRITQEPVGIYHRTAGSRTDQKIDWRVVRGVCTIDELLEHEWPPNVRFMLMQCRRLEKRRWGQSKLNAVATRSIGSRRQAVRLWTGGLVDAGLTVRTLELGLAGVVGWDRLEPFRRRREV